MIGLIALNFVLAVILAGIEHLGGVCTFPERGCQCQPINSRSSLIRKTQAYADINPPANLVSQSETNVITPNTRTLAASMRISAALKPATIGIFDMGTFSVPDTAG